MNLLQIFEFRNWDTEHYNSGLEIRVSLLGMHKWKPDICIGFSTALHLQCGNWELGREWSTIQDAGRREQERGRGTCL
jgi:hypothetical protein